MRKKIEVSLVISIIFCLSLPTKAVTIVSDLDDTIKITHVNSIEAVYNGLFSTKIFLGMNGLLQAYRQESADNKIVIVSGSPELLRPEVDRLLKKRKIPANRLFLTDGTPNKAAKLLELASRAKDGLILIGDDQESDPDFYAEVQRRYPEKVKAIYIHQLNRRVLPAGQQGYYSAYEVALYESAKGRLGMQVPDAIRAQIEAELAAKDLDDEPQSQRQTTRQNSTLLIPNWQKCSPKLSTKLFSEVSQIHGADGRYLSLLAAIVKRNCGRD